MANKQRLTIHLLLEFGDSVNQSGDLPLNADLLQRKLNHALFSLMELYASLRLLVHVGEAVSVCELDGTNDEPETVVLPAAPVADAGGGQ